MVPTTTITKQIAKPILIKHYLLSVKKFDFLDNLGSKIIVVLTDLWESYLFIGQIINFSTNQVTSQLSFLYLSKFYAIMKRSLK